ncbi:hypothetical protein PENANT_c007G04563 [Penicillium antarcticum]|uniref:Uncharacterized protein n=1 Tax=Penicillium antarcticum TaxID=416450 RepID=A0A1V6QC57_9EURO|nr:hypothetical protein PENANT_c007G04563 [Penicillium antarcticum]
MPRSYHALLNIAKADADATRSGRGRVGRALIHTLAVEVSTTPTTDPVNILTAQMITGHSMPVWDKPTLARMLRSDWMRLG